MLKKEIREKMRNSGKLKSLSSLGGLVETLGPVDSFSEMQEMSEMPVLLAPHFDCP